MIRSVYFVTLLSVATIGGMVSTTQAETARERVEEKVWVQKADFNNPAEVRSVYSRLKHTARDVCDSSVRLSGKSDRDCARQALADAVETLNRPALTALHQEKSGIAPTYAAEKAQNAVSQ